MGVELGILGLLSVIPLSVAADAVGLGAAAGAGFPTQERRLRFNAARRIHHVLRLTPPAPETNAHLQRALAIAWVDAGRRWMAEVRKTIVRDRRAYASALRIVEGVELKLAELENAAQDHAAEFDMFLSRHMAAFGRWIDGTSEGEIDFARWDEDILSEIEKRYRTLFAERAPAGASREMPFEILRRTGEHGRPVVVVELLDRFHMLIKSGDIPEATEAFHLYAVGAEVEALREEVKGEAEDTRAAVDRLAREVREQTLWVEHSAASGSSGRGRPRRSCSAPPPPTLRHA